MSYCIIFQGGPMDGKMEIISYEMFEYLCPLPPERLIAIECEYPDTSIEYKCARYIPNRKNKMIYEFDKEVMR